MRITLHAPAWSPVLAAAVALLCHAGALAQDESLPPGAMARLGTLRFRHAADIGALAVAPDGRRVASAGDDGRVYIFDRGTGRQVRVLHAREKDSILHHIVFSPDGKTLASCSKGDTRFWDVATGQMIRSLPESSDEVVFSPDGKFLAGMNWDKICLWETGTGRQLRQWQSPRVFLNKSMTFSADGQTLIAGVIDGTIYFWDPETGKERRRWSPLRSPAALQISSDGKTLAALDNSASIRRIHLWDVPSGRHLRCINTEASHKLARLALAADGKTIVAANDSEELFFCDAGRGKVTHDAMVPRGADCLCFVPGSRTLVTAGCGGVIRFWDSGSGKEIEPGVGHQAWISSLVFAPDGRTLYSAGADGTVRFWQVATGRELRCLRTRYLPYVPLGQIALCQEGRLLALQGVGVHLYNTADGREVRHLARDQLVDAMAFSGGEKPVLAVVGESPEDRGISLWDVASGRRLRKKSSYDAWSWLYFSADGKSLLSDWSAKGTSILDAATLKEVGRLRLSLQPGFALSADRRRLAVISQECFVELCEADSGRKLFAFEKAPEALSSLAFSADRATLASVGEHGVIRLWETATGQQRGSFAGHRRGVQYLAFAPDGRTLASAGVDTTILLWDLTGLAGSKRRPPSPQELQGLWKDLADRDAVRAYRAVWALAQFPNPSVSFLGERLRPAARPPERLCELIRALGSDSYAVRQEAVRELEKAEDLAEPALRAALAGDPDLEVRRRLQLLLGKLNERVRDPETLRAVRAVEALEHTGTAEARTVLEKLARGAEGARLTRQARAALERLSKRPARTKTD